MSLFNDSKNAGLALVVCAILLLLGAIVSIVCEFTDEGDTELAVIVAAIGAILGAFLYFGFGRSVMKRELTDKFDIVCRFVQVFAYVQIVEGIFYLWKDPASGIVNIIIGLIALFIYKKITDGKETLFDKLVWIVLLILFILTIIAGIVYICTITGAVLGIAYVFIGIFMTMSVLDNDVKAKFGM